MKKQEIKAIKYDVQEIGKHIKASKKRFSWTFSLDGRTHSIILDFSFISGKVKLVTDRKTLLQNELPSNVSFQHPFTLDGYALNILQQGQTFELRINNKVFSHLYNQLKTKNQFTNYEDQIKDIKVEEGLLKSDTGKVKLSIGGLGNMKKKNKGVESQNWGNLGGNNIGFPNYFGTTETFQTDKPVAKGLEKPTPQSNLLDDEQSKQEQKTHPERSQQSPSSFFQFSAEEKQPQVEQPEEKNTKFEDFFSQNVQHSSPPVSEPKVELEFNMNEQKTIPANNVENMFNQLNLNPVEKKVTEEENFFQMPAKEPQHKNDITEVYKTTPPSQASMMDFNTMQNLFATNMQNVMMPNPPPQNAYMSQSPQLNLDFPPANQTKQHMQTMQEPMKPVEPVHMPTMPSQGQNIQLNEFNTMQNLFHTQQFQPQNPTNFTLSAEPQEVKKQDDPFELLNSEMKKETSPSPMMNTISGHTNNKATGFEGLDLNNFATMQLGTNNQPDPFNFSKKPSDQNNDLI